MSRPPWYAGEFAILFCTCDGQTPLSIGIDLLQSPVLFCVKCRKSQLALPILADAAGRCRQELNRVGEGARRRLEKGKVKP